MQYISKNGFQYRITFNKLCKNLSTNELIRITAEILTFITA